MTDTTEQQPKHDRDGLADGTTATIADRTAEVLIALGVRRAYGLPGEDHLTLLDALIKRGIEYIAVANEAAAVLMAATEAAATHVPGLALVSLAPGLSNAMNGIVHAFLEGLPVLVVSGQHPSDRLPFIVRQGMDLEALVASTVKWSVRMVEGIDPGTVVCKAVEVAVAERPGPVYVEIAEDVASAAALPSPVGDRPIELVRAALGGTVTWLKPAAVPQADLDHLRARLDKATRPVLIVGGRRAEPSTATLEAFSQAFGMPVLLTPQQKGAVKPTNPLFAGAFLNGSLESDLLGPSDLVVFVNPDPFDFYNRPLTASGPVIAISSRPVNDWLLDFDRRIVGDVDDALRSLAAGPQTQPSRWTVSEIESYRHRVRTALTSPDPNETGLSVSSAIETVLSCLPPGAAVVADAGFSKPIILHLYHPAERGRFFASNALSTMGFSIPAAIALAETGRQVVAFMGDGSLLMRATELAMLHAVDNPPIFVAIVDGSLTQIQVKQSRRGLPDTGVVLPAVSCERLGAAVGLLGIDVTAAADLRAAVDRGLAARQPILIGAHVTTDAVGRLFETLRG